MGKHGKKQRHQRGRRRTSSHYLEEEERHPPLNPEKENDSEAKNTLRSKIRPFQQYVQMYVGKRAPLNLQEDFCGTALLSTEWLRADARRTAVGLCLDGEALLWCIENKIGADVNSRIFLFHGDVLEPLEAQLMNFNSSLVSSSQRSSSGVSSQKLMTRLPARDIVCALNYSCCCLRTRNELISYFRHTRNILNEEGAIFVMDLYGGTSAESEMILKSRFPFGYVLEETGFDIIQRKTTRSHHFNLINPRNKLSDVFSHSWRLLSLPEIKDCLEELDIGLSTSGSAVCQTVKR